ncbi:hypothetical protein DENSPDRAFT_844023 [Dentipellis sp. KUC8613]|nr:hypothetical protein DENSPDRAFT_844023 [Dentipellis sp. KUC8613]
MQYEGSSFRVCSTDKNTRQLISTAYHMCCGTSKCIDCSYLSAISAYQWEHFYAMRLGVWRPTMVPGRVESQGSYLASRHKNEAPSCGTFLMLPALRKEALTSSKSRYPRQASALNFLPMPPLQEPREGVPIGGSGVSKGLGYSCGTPSLASHVPPILSAATSSAPYASRGDVFLPYDVVLDLAAISPQTFPNGQAIENETFITPYSSPTIPSDYRTFTNMSTTSVRPLGPPPISHHPSSPPSRQFEAMTQVLIEDAPEACTASTEPLDGLSRGKKRKPQTPASNSHMSDHRLVGDSRRTTSALVSLKGRERERDLIALLRFMVFGERTAYTTRCNGIKQADVAHKKHGVLRAAIDKIDELRKRVDLLDALVKHQKLDLRKQEEIIYSLQGELASMQRQAY